MRKNGYNQMRIVILGAKGMAGHMINLFLKENTSDEIIPLSRNEFNVENNWQEVLSNLNSEKKIDIIINSIGILKKNASENPIQAIKINSLFPHELVKFADVKGIKIIHLSTDCYNDLDVYGRSKRSGEINYPNHLTIRTSIIGPELKSNGSGLFHWFMMQKEDTQGFINHYWDGITTLELAKQIKRILQNKDFINGIKEIRSASPISKYVLLLALNKVFRKNLNIIKKETDIIDKTNSNPIVSITKSIEEQVIDLNLWMKNHQEVYPQYFS